MTPEPSLATLVDVWRQAAADVVALLRTLREDEWQLPTDLPGWDVRAVAAHLAHLESALAGNPQEPVEVGELAHVRGVMGRFTEEGPLARAGWPTHRIIEELESSVAQRHATLTAGLPEDPDAPADGFAGLLGWSWRTLLSNRPLDLWMHEQDIRRATGRPGGLDSPAAAHVAQVFARSLPYVLGKKVGAPVGTAVVLEVTGAHPQAHAATVGEDGRGAPLPEPPATPTARLRLDFEGWIVLAGGRRGPDRVAATVEGDEELGRQLLGNLAVTP